jgi:eukaryotic-like serine/threonine-protein kinase
VDRQQWTRVTRTFDAVRLVPAGSREAWLEQHCGDDEIRAEVAALLRAYEEAPGNADTPPSQDAAGGAVRVRVSRPAAGRRIGAYRIVSEIGRGGMGVVYEALRDDEEFSRRVAIKVLPSGWIGSELAARFRVECRVLAGLDHPGIARLFDAGTTDDGVPFLVMELVEGQPVDEWCRERKLEVRQRLDLMIRIAEAVGHAHQNLVVHRDLKPGNILVTDEGHPKLLDFGIAKLLSDESDAGQGLTQTGQQAFTPEFASPEQVRGETVTTSSDLYSLGVLLYLLLTGQPPYDLENLSPLEVARRVCDAEPALPSRLAPGELRGPLAGDLDNIVLKALRKEPRERYVSVFALADDLQAWLDGRPVAATRATLWYRVRKNIARHKAQTAAAAAVVVALAGGGIATTWQAHVARVERDKAENRFRQVRQFSRSLLFEIHESLRALPGATEPRRQLLARAVQFLDGLAKDAGDDAPLKIELAEGYRRLGQVQGSRVSENVGDVRAAVVSFQKAVQLGEEAIGLAPRSVPAADVTTGAYDDLSGALLDVGDVDAAERAFGRHKQLAERLEREHRGDALALASVASSYVNLGYFRGARKDTAGAKPFYARAVVLYEAMPEAQRRRTATARSYGFALKRLGAVLASEGNLPEAERRYKAALAVDQAIVQANPGNPSYRFDMTFSLTDLGYVARKRKDYSTAADYYGQALAIRREAVAADPSNVRAARGVANVLSYLGSVHHELGRHAEAIGEYHEAFELYSDVARRRGGSSDVAEATDVGVAAARCMLDVAEALPRGKARQDALAGARGRLVRTEAGARTVAPGASAPAPGPLQAWERQTARLRALSR